VNELPPKDPDDVRDEQDEADKCGEAFRALVHRHASDLEDVPDAGTDYHA